MPAKSPAHALIDRFAVPSFRWSQRRSVAGWLGVFLLFFNILAGVLVPAAEAGASPARFTQDRLGDEIVICTAAGMVVLDRNGKPVDDGRPHSSHDAFCVFCLPLMHAGSTAPVAETVVLRPASTAVSVALPDAYRSPIPGHRHHPHAARAPPFLA